MSEKISVIMGVYNCKNFSFLEQSIKSIISQTYTNWELVICDDGSTNETAEVLKKLSKLDNRIKIIGYKNNKGLAYALNECLKVSKGKFIARQDDDDISMPRRLEEEYKFLLEHPEYCMVGCCATIYDKEGVWGHYGVSLYPSKQDFYRSNPFMHPSMMFRRKILDEVQGYRVAKETRRCEDYDIFMRIYAKGYLGANLKDELYRYYMTHNDKKKHRPMKYRIDEAKVRYVGFKNMGILKGGLPYIVKPIIAGLIPARMFSKFQNRQYYK
jgi:glycosyltransferase EpsE